MNDQELRTIIRMDILEMFDLAVVSELKKRRESPLESCLDEILNLIHQYTASLYDTSQLVAIIEQVIGSDEEEWPEVNTVLIGDGAAMERNQLRKEQRERLNAIMGETTD